MPPGREGRLKEKEIFDLGGGREGKKKNALSPDVRDTAS